MNAQQYIDKVIADVENQFNREENARLRHKLQVM